MRFICKTKKNLIMYLCIFIKQFVANFVESSQWCISKLLCDYFFLYGWCQIAFWVEQEFTLNEHKWCLKSISVKQQSYNKCIGYVMHFLKLKYDLDTKWMYLIKQLSSV